MNQIPIYIISLKRTPERRLCMQRQLDSLGLDYQWIDAVDAHDFNDTELIGVDLKNHYQPSAMACLLSHIKFYDLVIKNKHPMACLLEDDTQLLPTFPDILNYEKLSKRNWGILLLSHHSLITRNLLTDYCKSFVDSSGQKMTDILIDWGCTVGAITKNSCTKYIKDHYITKVYSQSGVMVPKAAMAYLIRLSTAEKLRKIAFANRKSLFADDITGYADHLGVPLRLISPPCAKLNITYLNFSTILPINSGKSTTTINFSHLKLLQLYARNRWIALASLLFRGKLSIKLIKIFLHISRRIAYIKIKMYLRPHIRFNPRIRKIID